MENSDSLDSNLYESFKCHELKNIGKYFGGIVISTHGVRYDKVTLNGVSTRVRITYTDSRNATYSNGQWTYDGDPFNITATSIDPLMLINPKSFFGISNDEWHLKIEGNLLYDLQEIFLDVLTDSSEFWKDDTIGQNWENNNWVKCDW